MSTVADGKSGRSGSLPRRNFFIAPGEENEAVTRNDEPDNASWDDVESLRTLERKADSSGTSKRVRLSQVVKMCMQHWYNTAIVEAEGGEVDSMILLAQMLFSGYGCKQDVARGKEWLNKARMLRAEDERYESSAKMLALSVSGGDPQAVNKFKPPPDGAKPSSDL